MKKQQVLLAIIALSVFLRFYKLGQNPPSLNLDEVAIGYNAYSILATGQDEYGKTFPLVFRSHDDYKPPLYIYLTVPSIAVFGVNEFAVRFPSALFGSLTVALIYFFVSELFKNSSLKAGNRKTIALLSALLLCVNPWHLQFSRAGFETNLAVFFVLTGSWAYLKGLNGERRNWWFVTALAFALSLYTYQAARLFIPLFSLLLIIIASKSILAAKRKCLEVALFFLFLVFPLVPLAFSAEGQMRFKGTSVFEHPGLWQEEQSRRLVDAAGQDGLSLKIFHHPYFAASLTVIDGYLKHLRPDLLFLGRQGPPYNYTPNVGLLYLIELPFIIWGLHKVFGFPGKGKIVLLGWLFLSPLAASLTWDIPSSTRTALMLPPLEILTAVGIGDFLLFFSKGKFSGKFALYLLLIPAAFSFGHYLHQYYLHAPREYAASWQYGYKEAVLYAGRHLGEYDKVIVSTNLRQGQNFFAFYLRYDPRKYIYEDGGTVSGGFLENRNKFGKFEFHPIDYQNLNSQQKVLLIDTFEQMNSEFKVKALETIYLPDGKPTLTISEN